MAEFRKYLLVFGLICVNAQQLPHSYIPIGIAKKPATCKYEFTVPDTKGACSATSAALEKKIDDLKNDLDRTRTQYLSQNGVVQGTLSQLQTDTHAYVSKVTDLNSELQKIKQKLNSGSNGGNPNLNQLIHDTKDLLTKAVSDINGRIFNVTLEFQRNAVEESKVNSAIQNQINKQAVQLATAEQKLLNLENMIKNYKPSTSSTPSGPTNVQMNTLQQKYQQLEQNLKTVDALQQQQFRGLSDKTNKIMSQLMNQSHDIDAIAQTANQSVTRLEAAEKSVQSTKQDLDKFKQSINPQVQILSQEASSLLNNLTSVQTQLGQIGTKFMTGQVSTIMMKADVKRVKKQADDLVAQIAKLSTQVYAQGGELLGLKADLSGLNQAANTGSTNSTGGSLNVQQIVNTIKSQTQADIAKAQKEVNQVKTMVTTLLTQVSMLSTKVNKLARPSG